MPLGLGMLWRPTPVTVALLWCCPFVCRAQNESAGNCSTNGSGNDSNSTCHCDKDCCGDNIRREAYLACKEWMTLGLTEEICLQWMPVAQRECENSCSNCEAIGLIIYGQCLFFLQTLMPNRLAQQQCADMRTVFELSRCPSACIKENKECYGEEFEECEAICGNYRVAPGVSSKGCTCWRDRKQYGFPYTCEGETMLKGLIPGDSGVIHDCRNKPSICNNDEVNKKCGKYQYCPTDVCIVKNITCPWKNDCLSEGYCQRYNGYCSYFKKPEGQRCTDGHFWSHGDTCYDGQCIGIEDKCLRYEVVCETQNDCMQNDYRPLYDGNLSHCEPVSGACMFKPRPDGIFCSSYPGGENDGTCKNGMCMKFVPDKCINRLECPDLGQCYEASVCENFTGSCLSVYKRDGTPCDDSRAETHRDLCIEGRCVGDPFKEPTFQTMGDGDCIDAMPGLKTNADVSIDHQPIARYYVDAFDETTCEIQCRDDPECVAFSFGHHSCGIYGTRRKLNPDAEVWGNNWMLETTRHHITHAVTCWSKTEGETWSFYELVREYLFPITMFVMVGIPTIFVFLAFKPTLRRSWRRINGLPAEDGTGSPRNSTMVGGGFTNKVLRMSTSSAVDRLRSPQLSPKSGSPRHGGEEASPRCKPQPLSMSPLALPKQGKPLPIETDDDEALRLGPSNPGSPAVEQQAAADPRGQVEHPSGLD